MKDPSRLMSVETCQNPTNACELDFRPEFLRTHFDRLTREGRSREESAAIICDIAQRDFGYLFLERFTKEKLVRYSYSVEGGRVFSPKYGALGEVDKLWENGVAQREIEGRTSGREKAEQGGFIRIKEELLGANSTLTFVWMSPPPPKSELCNHPGYDWKTSFYFLGKLSPEMGRLDMFAWRNEKLLSLQIDELNGIAGEQVISSEAHPNDFLRKPVFKACEDFSFFREVIADLPPESNFESTQEADFSIYADGIRDSAILLTNLIVNDADDDTLRVAQLRIEMDFTRWVTDGFITRAEVPPVYLEKEAHRGFAAKVMQDFARFVPMYQTDRFACGSCGSSVMSLFLNNALYLPSQLQFLTGELLPRYISCPGCGESVKAGSAECKSCGLKKSDYDSGGAELKPAA